MTKILLAEDDEFLRDIYTEILEEENFDVTAAEDGREALKEIKIGGWDLVLLDVIMPHMTGIDVLKEIKNSGTQNLSKHILFLSNTDQPKGIEEVIDLTDGFIIKSAFTPGELIKKLKMLLEET